MVSFVYISGTDFENLFPLTKKERPVSNLTVLGRPIAVWIAQTAINSGLRDVIIAYPSISGQVRGAIGEKVSLIECAGKPTVKCAIEAILQAKDNDIALLVGSHIFPPDLLQSALDSWNEAGGRLLAVLVPDQLPPEEKAGRIGVDVEFIGKFVRRAGLFSEGAFPYIFSGSLLGEKEEILSAFNKADSINGALLEMFRRSRPSFYIYSGRYNTLSSPWQLLELVKSLLTETAGIFVSSGAKVSPTAIIEGPVVVEDGATIDHYSVIKGPAYISRGAFVGAHTLLRNGVSLEPYAVVGAGVELKRSYVGSRATIGSNSNVTDSVIGEGATLRPVVVTLNYDVYEAKKKGELYRKRGSIVGEGAIVNGGTTLKPGFIVEPEQVYP